MTDEVIEIQNQIKTGEEAIKFFAKYGNTTPIKFIHCERVQHNNPAIFRPYDLTVIDMSESQKEQTLTEYYTISAHGIVHVVSDNDMQKNQNGKFTSLWDQLTKQNNLHEIEEDEENMNEDQRKALEKKRKDRLKQEQQNQNTESFTQVKSLSDWMHESTMFNIITNIQFFKNYAISKIFNIWKANMHYRYFCKTRKKLISNNFICKPAFADHLMKVNTMMYEIISTKTIDLNNSQNKYQELNDGFKGEQKVAKQKAKTHYNEVISKKIIEELTLCCTEVQGRLELKDSTEIDEQRFGQQVKQQPIHQKKLEDKEREYLLNRAQQDQGMLKSFIRLVDYITIETLVITNYESMNLLVQEMRRKDRKQALFQLVVTFDVNSMNYQPEKKEVMESIQTLFDEMIQTMKGCTRVLQEMSDYIKYNSDTTCDIQTIIQESKEYQDFQVEVMAKIKGDFQLAEEYVANNYQKCRIIHDAHNNEEEGQKFFQQEQTVEDIKKVIEIYRDYKEKLEGLKSAPKGIFHVYGEKMKGVLDAHVRKYWSNLELHMHDIMFKKAERLSNDLQQYNENLDNTPNNLKEYTEYISNFNEIEQAKNAKKIENIKDETEDMRTLLSREFFYQLRAQEQVIFDNIKKKYEDLFIDSNDGDEEEKVVGKYNKAKEYIENEKPQMKLQIEKDLESLKTKIKGLSETVNQEILINEDTIPDQALGKLQHIKQQIDRHKKEDDKFIKYYQLMYPVEKLQPNMELREVNDKYSDRKLLWTHYKQQQKISNEWMKDPFTSLDFDSVQSEMKTFVTGVAQLKTRIHNLSKTGKDDLLAKQEREVKDLQQKMPIMLSLGNKNIKDKHWQEIFEVLQQPNLSPGTHFTLKDLIDAKILDKIDVMEEISSRASGEADIISSLDEIEEKWKALAFIVNQYRDAKDQKFTLGSVEEIYQNLDDHQLKLQSILGSRYVHHIRSQVERWEKTLVYVSDVIDEWLACQRQWMYLENIFNAEDIQKQLPAETQKFQQVDKFWKGMMGNAHKKPMVLEILGHDIDDQQILRKFQNNNKILDDIQKQLENYLETKRSAFPRFYFLSNDELLEILSQTRNPHAVQPHLRKCFDNINRIVFTDTDDSIEIIAMVSAEPEIMPEKVDFSGPVFSEGAVEHWLMRIQEMMCTTLYDMTKKANETYPETIDNLPDWLFNYPAQSVLVCDQIQWTKGCTEAISKMKTNPKALNQYLDYQNQYIAQMVNIVRNDLNVLQRTLMGALIVIDVHGKSVVNTMTNNQVDNIYNFDWTKQLRYYWEQDVNDVVARQTNTYFRYAYEYLGNGPRLVITPLTDKCYITLTGAKHLSYGGAPAGPAGTGKTETTKDLAKALAVQCVVFNCSDGLDYKTMGRFFSGLAQGGAWACFDEFNRIDIEVLSVVAQQILTIQQGIRMKLDVFEFEGRTINLNSRFGVFITMNPGYAGRTELPDNLKALFRPVAMMIPDYGLIAEIILFSEGFETANTLANKMVNLYKLSSEQLSKQDHYDFGMRAVKSVLVMAGALRRKESHLAEEIVLIRAMRDSNVPKFLVQDLPLFTGIIQDLFPTVKIPTVDFGDLQKAINNQLELKHYQKPEKFITKIIQLMQTLQVRHGVMVVGQTGVGKTTNITTLKGAVEQLFKEGSTDYYHNKVKLEILNPKSVSMNELFGYTNVLTNEWTDGIVAKIIRDNVADTSDSKKWVVFDGPVDALWIENMNTVLDDNRMLCLNNGQRIKLPQTFTMMFEVQDLAVASPATVSRCGMVFMEHIHLGWEPIIDTWSYYFKKNNGGTEVNLQKMIDTVRGFFKDMLPIVRAKCKEVVPTVDNNLITSCLNLVDIMTMEARESQGFKENKPEDQDFLYTLCIIFSFIWSCGGNIYDENRKEFSNALRKQVLNLKTSQILPFEGDVYDYYIDFKAKQFVNWSTLVSEFVYNKDTPYFNILVPTSDTVKFQYLIEKLTKNKFNTLLTGETGVGKSVIINGFLNSLDKDKFSTSIQNFSAQTSTSNLLDLFMDKDKFARKSKNSIGPPPPKKMVLFIDDINMPALEKYYAQPPIELLRQIIDQKGFYDLKKLIFIRVEDVIFITCCARPEGGRNHVTPRLYRHFNMFWNPELSQKSMEKIYRDILKGFLNENYTPSKPELLKYADPIVKQTVDIYFKLSRELLPTPQKSHYTFNLRDVSKVFQGILQIEYVHCKSKDTLAKLWIHETSRVFHDRLVNETDRNWFYDLYMQKLEEKFADLEITREELIATQFGDYTDPNKNYIHIEDNSILAQKFNEQLNLYNAQNPKQMNLVFFSDAIMHLSRICRILRTQRGNALLIGVGGSGRQSLTRMASTIRQYTIFSIEITKNYKDSSFKEDLKILLKRAGCKNQPTVFLFSDTQIVKESFLEDINNILNTGEVPNLWGVDDIEEIKTEILQLAKENNIEETREKLLKFFVTTVRENLHIVLTFSPVGPKLRDRCRQFPSIINCCSINWFDKWPDQALQEVALKQLQSSEHLKMEVYIKPLAEICVKLQQDVQMYSDKFYEELRRKNYVTPTSYLELLKTYISMMREQQNVLPLKISKYTVGLQTLKETEVQIGELQQKIKDFQPHLEKNARDNKILVAELEVKSKEANEQAETVGKETDIAQGIRDEANAQKQEVAADLAQAQPILDAAVTAVNKIDKDMINTMKSYTSPPELVMFVMCAVCLLFGQKEDWENSTKILKDMHFLQKLKDFSNERAQALSSQKWAKLNKEYLKNARWNKEGVEKVSTPAVCIFVWVESIYKYNNIKKIVIPKEKALEEAISKLNAVEKELSIKQKTLQEIQDMVNNLQKELSDSQRKAQQLQFAKETAELHLIRAEKLLGGLSKEAERWKESAELLNQDMDNLYGNVILAAASIAYLGPFVSTYRQKLVKKWISYCQQFEVPIDRDFTLKRILAEEMTIRDWQEHGLPADTLSIDNAIFIFNCARWPLIIDPQGQANKWIKQLGQDTTFHTTKFSENNYLKTLENSIRFGQWVLLENVEEELDPSIEPILLKQFSKKGNQYILRLGDQDVVYNNEFKFFLTTKLPNPHYIPEISIKTTIINFTVTPQGLEDQLLVEVVRYERIELEETRISLILTISQDKKQLQDLEDKILRQIAQSQGKILEDEELIAILDASKITSETVNERMALSKTTSIEIDKAREEYRPIARRGSIIYFVIAGLQSIDPMYQYSLDFFIKFFKLRLDKSEKPSDEIENKLQERSKILINDMTKNFYINICRGLFEKDKLLYSYLINTSILQSSNDIKYKEWSFFLRGGVTPEDLEIPEHWDKFQKEFKALLQLSVLSTFENIKENLEDQSQFFQWEAIITNQIPENVELPLVYQGQLSLFQELLLQRCIKPERFIQQVKKFVKTSLGPVFIESPGFDLKASFNDSTCTTPLIFILSPGADPMSYLLNLAKEQEVEDKLKILSLGQGQGDIAKEAIKTGRRNGNWVCLQNCHLAVSWMVELERIQELQVENDTHPDYRLWLTSMPSTAFPVPVLQSGLKLTNEPPKGLKANITRTYNEVNVDQYDNCNKPFEFKKLLFSLAFFHAVILERRKFGAIGWNINYDWMNSDFQTCQMQLFMYLEEQDDVPWTTLRYLISEINYGGRVTDDKDVRLITALLEKYFTIEIMDGNYSFAPGGIYNTPINLEIEAIKTQISQLPMEDDPQVFGLHENANITFQQKTVKEFFDTLLENQPRSSGGSGAAKPEDEVQRMALQIADMLPQKGPVVKQSAKPNSLEVFRNQEIIQMNRLLQVMKQSLVNLNKAIKGEIVMSIELEEMMNSFLLKRVPENWTKVAYPSLKPLKSWINDFIERVKFYELWVEDLIQKSYWMSAMFFPQGFITAALQTYSREEVIAIDTLSFKTNVLTKSYDQLDVSDIPTKGVNVHGLFIQGCRWNIPMDSLDDSVPGVLFEEVPVIYLDPIQKEQNITSGQYQCPLYKESTRRGTLSTTGHSTNFIMYMSLKSVVNPDNWIRSGVALLCQLDD